MAKLEKTVMIYDPVTRTERARMVTIEGNQLLLDCLEQDTSCLDLQMLSEAADGAPSCEVTLKVRIEPIKRRRGFR